MKARISQLHMTEVEWLKYSSLIPESGEFIVYDPDSSHQYARIKVGDGKRTIKELDFFIDSTIEELLKQIRFEDSIDGGRITEYYKN
jgi:hypothetical protein